jgi:predicted acyl esterase
MKSFLNFIFIFLSVLSCFSQQTKAAQLEDLQSAYDVQDSVMITTRDGSLLSAMVVRRKGINAPKPVILQYTIYVRDKGRDLKSLKEAADKDYVGVIAYTRYISV